MRTALTLVLVLSAASFAGAQCSETLEPYLLRELPLKVVRSAHGIAWISGGTVAVGSKAGIFEYTVADGGLRRIVSGQPVPEGLPRAEDVAVHRNTLVAFNLEYGDLAFDLGAERITSVRRTPAIQIFDMDVHEGNLLVLGYPGILRRDQDGALWIGAVGKPWETFRILHTISDRAGTIFRSGVPPFGGAVKVQNDGTITMISPAQPGVQRYRADGTQLPALGGALTELVVPRLPEIRGALRLDLAAWYQQILNRQPLADDLVETGDGLAIVVRRAERSGVRWELWFPASTGGVTRRIRLGLHDPSQFAGHLRCDGRGRRLACLFGKATSLRTPDVPYVALFDLDRIRRSGSCGS